MIYSRLLMICLFILGLTSCGEYLVESSEVTPIAKAKSFKEVLSNDGRGYITKTIFVPLNASNIYHYDHDAVVQREDLSNESNLTSIVEGLKVGFLNLGMNLSGKNKVKISSEFDFSFIDTSFVKQVKIKNVFFNIKGCAKRNETCQSRIKDKALSLNILKEMFINFSPLERSVLKDEVDINTSIKNYYSASKKAFRPFLNSQKITGDSLFENYTIANYNYSKSKTAKDVERVIIVRAASDYSWDLKSLLSGIHYSKQVEVTKLIGDHLYVKLKEPKFKKNFLISLKKEKIFRLSEQKLTDLNEDKFFTKKRRSSILECTNKKCMNFNVNQSNLIPLIEKSPLIKVDTFLNLNRLTKTDFEYQGLLEIEIKIDISN